MATANVSVQVLRPSKAPNLMIGPVDYTQQFMDQYSNILRLYFNEIDNYTAALSNTDGGGYIKFPNFSAYHSPSQYALNNTVTNVIFDTTTSISGFTLNANSTVTSNVSGVFKLDYSLQFANNDNAQWDVDVWVKVNNTNLTESATRFTLAQRKSAGISSYVCGYSHVTFPVNAGDVIGLEWATTNAATANASALGIYMPGIAAATTPYICPSIPSSIVTIQFVSAPLS